MRDELLWRYGPFEAFLLASDPNRDRCEIKLNNYHLCYLCRVDMVKFQAGLFEVRRIPD